ncbi:hypothetical protein [Streptosporangium sp. NPDC006930]
MSVELHHRAVAATGGVVCVDFLTAFLAEYTVDRLFRAELGRAR